jgi:hypothetical protein
MAWQRSRLAANSLSHSPPAKDGYVEVDDPTILISRSTGRCYSEAAREFTGML